MFMGKLRGYSQIQGPWTPGLLRFASRSILHAPSCKKPLVWASKMVVFHRYLIGINVYNIVSWDTYQNLISHIDNLVTYLIVWHIVVLVHIVLHANSLDLWTFKGWNMEWTLRCQLSGVGIHWNAPSRWYLGTVACPFCIDFFWA